MGRTSGRPATLEPAALTGAWAWPGVWRHHSGRTAANFVGRVGLQLLRDWRGWFSLTWIEPERELAVVVPWINRAHADEFFGLVLKAIDEGATG